MFYIRVFFSPHFSPEQEELLRMSEYIGFCQLYSLPLCAGPATPLVTLQRSANCETAEPVPSRAPAVTSKQWQHVSVEKNVNDTNFTND